MCTDEDLFYLLSYVLCGSSLFENTSFIYQFFDNFLCSIFSFWYFSQLDAALWIFCPLSHSLYFLSLFLLRFMVKSFSSIFQLFFEVLIFALIIFISKHYSLHVAFLYTCSCFMAIIAFRTLKTVITTSLQCFPLLPVLSVFVSSSFCLLICSLSFMLETLLCLKFLGGLHN